MYFTDTKQFLYAQTSLPEPEPHRVAAFLAEAGALYLLGLLRLLFQLSYKFNKTIQTLCLIWAFSLHLQFNLLIRLNGTNGFFEAINAEPLPAPGLDYPVVRAEHTKAQHSATLPKILSQSLKCDLLSLIIIFFQYDGMISLGHHQAPCGGIKKKKN